MTKDEKKKTSFSDIAKKTAKEGIKAGIKAKNFVQEVIEEVQEDKIDTKQVKQKEPSMKQRFMNNESIKGRPPQRQMERRPMSSMEEQIAVWQGWFWGTMTYGLLIILSFMISSADERFVIVPWILLIGFPFFLFRAIVNSIPEIKIGRRVIFSRKDVSLQSQLTFTKTVLRTFSTQMFKNNPFGAFLILIFMGVLLWVIIAPFLA